MDDREKRAREYLERVKREFARMFSKKGSQEFYREHLAAETPALWVAAAREGDPDAIEFLREYCREASRTGAIVPRDLHEFVFEWFRDGKPRRSKAGASAKSLGLRNLNLAILAKIVHTEFGYPLYCAPEHRGGDGPLTTCHLLAETFGLKERTVERIVGDRKAILDGLQPTH